MAELPIENPPRLLAFSVCDDVRVEQFGKLILIGYYGVGISVPRLPVTLPKLSFLAQFAYFTEQWSVSVRLMTPSNTVLLEASDVAVDIRKDAGIPPEFRQNYLFFQVVPMPLNEQGVYKVFFRFSGIPELQVNFYVGLQNASETPSLPEEFRTLPPTRRLEYGILSRMLQYNAHEGWPATIPTIRQLLGPLIPNYQDEQGVEAIKRLASNNSLAAQKWDVGAGRFRSYEEYEGNDLEFFYKGDFKLLRTPYTEVRLEEYAKS
jgi:hypothetical protein